MKPDYYDILGVSRTATSAEIRRAFRQKARELHPDVNPGPDATRRFQELNAAYEVLGDPVRRSVYDRSPSSRPPRRTPPPPSVRDYRTYTPPPPRTEPPPPPSAQDYKTYTPPPRTYDRGPAQPPPGTQPSPPPSPRGYTTYTPRQPEAGPAPLFSSLGAQEMALISVVVLAFAIGFEFSFTRLAMVFVAMAALTGLTRLRVFGRYTRPVSFLIAALVSGLFAIAFFEDANHIRIGMPGFTMHLMATLLAGTVAIVLASSAYFTYLYQLTVGNRLPRRALPGVILLVVVVDAAAGMCFGGFEVWHDQDLLAVGVMLAITILITGGWTLFILTNGFAPRSRQ